jgi:hypothetical protein
MISSVEKRIDKTNRALKKLKESINLNTDKTKKYLDDVIKDANNISKPAIDELKSIYKLNIY